MRLWLPLFVLWPLALALGVLALPIAIVADVVLFLLGRRYYRYTILLARVFALCRRDTRDGHPHRQRDKRPST